MDKDLFRFMSCFIGLKTNKPSVENDPEYVFSDTELDRVLREIFSVDERTGLPMGDLAYYLSPDGNPTVKDWLVNNLLKPRAAQGQNPENLSDDLIVECSRGADESVSDYSSRLLGIYISAKAEYDKFISESDSK